MRPGADGTSLGEAIAGYPRAGGGRQHGEGRPGSFLEDVLKRVADTEHQEDLKAKMISAAPVFLSIVGFLVLNILVIFFVPKFRPISRLEQGGAGVSQYLINTT